MSALPRHPSVTLSADSAAEPFALRVLRLADLPAVMAIERRVYAQPWSDGNFIDSLAAGYLAMAMWHRKDKTTPPQLCAYFLAMKGVDEMHLLNISVQPEFQGQGLAQRLLDALVQQCRDQRCAQLWLEVRQGNERARQVYARYGFSQVGVRRAYYPSHQGQREDAVLMSLPIQEAACLPDIEQEGRPS
ncbi:ribosomal protein S18-alanine N-acetyltransferase [Roseateles koreensis]|uniref:[Ribosomal protein bS18]-alanine N-acetyltransferase n=1 Tax=Roseateles koreensis TaxID=2987526 RepID=A0ABT5KQ81_9BURK|nr:ribosomal protein S18-alanine N-acetyltransferase [Roseateles koreensis]MDC8784610.1 ribosomal protein S18-alanine N-acetyltransferase [Roseateles koreensis]